jgi:hypothetical protein
MSTQPKISITYIFSISVVNPPAPLRQLDIDLMANELEHTILNFAAVHGFGHMKVVLKTSPDVGCHFNKVEGLSTGVVDPR